MDLSIGARSGPIDVLRGLSIVLVLLHHFDLAYTLRDTVLAGTIGWPLLHAVVRNGNYAVTMFFVISGYLITTNAERRWGALRDIRAAAFYRFRAARILPCLVLLLATVHLLAAAGIGIFGNHPEFGGPVPSWIVDLASLTFWMNVLMARSGWLNYVLCVQWSLSIEEVFYLAFPLLCLALRHETRLLLFWSLFIVVGPIWRGSHQDSEYLELNSYLSCFDGIALGCCAAVLGKRIRLPAWSVTPITAAVAAAMAWFYLSASIGHTAVYGVTAMAFGTAVLLAVQPLATPGPSTPLSAPLRVCGRLSYELYLFHLVVLALLRTVWPPEATAGPAKPVLLAAYLGLSVAVAALVGRHCSAPLDRRLRGDAIRRVRLRTT